MPSRKDAFRDRDDDRDWARRGPDDDDRSRRGQRNTKSSDFPWGLVALILAVVLGIPAILGVFVLFVALFIGMTVRDTIRQVEDEAAQARAAGEMPPPPVPQPLPPPGVLGKKTVDLVALIDPVLDGGGRKWTIQNQVLRCEDSSFVPRLRIPYQPPREYDFIVTFSQPNLRNGIALIMPNPNGGSFFWAIGQENGSAYCFHSNPDKGGQMPGLIQPNTAYTTVVQVRRDGVTALLDGRVLMRLKTDFKDLTCDNWRDLLDKSCLGISCDDPTVFHYVRVVEITGQGNRTR